MMEGTIYLVDVEREFSEENFIASAWDTPAGAQDEKERLETGLNGENKVNITPIVLNRPHEIY